MEATRGVLLRGASIGRHSVAPGTAVWIVATRGELREVEYRDARAVLPANDVATSPVARPTEAQLRRLDKCFGLPEEAFTKVHLDAEHLFMIQKCKAHGRLFLRDTRGTIGLYERVTLLKPEDSEDWLTVWSRYHQMSDDWLNLGGRTW
jgi:hypothetical protein